MEVLNRHAQRTGRWTRSAEDMARCEVCGNDYDKAFSVTMPGGDSHTFDSFEREVEREACLSGAATDMLGLRPFLLARLYPRP